MDAVEIRNVTKRFGDVTAVDDLTLAVPEGSVYGFIGPNGSGKTTTMRMIVNILRPDGGSIRVLGEEILGKRADLIGYLPEERGLYRKMQVLELLEFYGELRGGRSVRADAESWLNKLDLARCGELKIENLSKGMSQKVQFIAAVLPPPKLLILDEPFTGLDPVSRDQLQEAILDLRQGGATVILSTHDMHVAESMCDYIFMIFRGKKVLDGTLESIQGRYPSDTIRVAVEDVTAPLEGLPGVTSVRDCRHYHELRLAGTSDPQEVLRSLVSFARVDSFSIVKPSLHDIFVRIAGPAAAEEAAVA
jgi:ABC-2 type transport system ATP-binding protein